MPSSVAVVGNCQTLGIANCLEALAPGVKVGRFAVNNLPNDDLRRDAIVDMKHYDVILSHNLDHQRFGLFTRENLSREFSNVLFFPQIMFGGFHPDDACFRVDGRFWESPLGTHHSLLVAAAFKAGISPDRVPKLFNTYIFARLGYFDEYELWKSSLLSHAAALDYDLSDAIGQWQRSGPFMHIPRHPAIRVISDIAERVAVKAGLSIEGSTENVEDNLQNFVIPVYPALAKRFGLVGDTIFRLGKESLPEGAKKPKPRGTAKSKPAMRKEADNIPQLGVEAADYDAAMSWNARNDHIEKDREATDKFVEIGLGAFVHRAYRMYRKYPQNLFDIPRLQKARLLLQSECT